jgi:hypothetical protein
MENEIIVNGIEYVRKEKPENPDIRIVILQRGWNMVGRFEREGADCKLHDASVIRCWGTEKGLGQIAKNGPTSKTILDKTHGVVEFDYLTVVSTIACEGKEWLNAI